MKTPVGVIGFVDVEPVDEKSITNSHARKAGYDNADALLKAVNKVERGSIYKVTLKYLSEDPRIELRQKTELSDEEMEELIIKLNRLDKTRGPWVLTVLQLIKKNPERRAAELAEIMKMDKFDFKINVRKLKNLGLTISHGIGYSISPRGELVINILRTRILNNSSRPSSGKLH